MTKIKFSKRLKWIIGATASILVMTPVVATTLVACSTNSLTDTKNPNQNPSTVSKPMKLNNLVNAITQNSHSILPKGILDSYSASSFLKTFSVPAQLIKQGIIDLIEKENGYQNAAYYQQQLNIIDVSIVDNTIEFAVTLNGEISNLKINLGGFLKTQDVNSQNQEIANQIAEGYSGNLHNSLKKQQASTFTSADILNYVKANPLSNSAFWSKIDIDKIGIQNINAFNANGFLSFKFTYNGAVATIISFMDGFDQTNTESNNITHISLNMNINKVNGLPVSTPLTLASVIIYLQNHEQNFIRNNLDVFHIQNPVISDFSFVQAPTLTSNAINVQILNKSTNTIYNLTISQNFSNSQLLLSANVNNQWTSIVSQTTIPVNSLPTVINATQGLEYGNNVMVDYNQALNSKPVLNKINNLTEADLKQDLNLAIKNYINNLYTTWNQNPTTQNTITNVTINQLSNSTLSGNIVVQVTNNSGQTQKLPSIYNELSKTVSLTTVSNSTTEISLENNESYAFKISFNLLGTKIEPKFYYSQTDSHLPVNLGYEFDNVTLQTMSSLTAQLPNTINNLNFILNQPSTALNTTIKNAWLWNSYFQNNADQQDFGISSKTNQLFTKTLQSLTPEAVLDDLNNKFNNSYQEYKAIVTNIASILEVLTGQLNPQTNEPNTKINTNVTLLDFFTSVGQYVKPLVLALTKNSMWANFLGDLFSNISTQQLLEKNQAIFDSFKLPGIVIGTLKNLTINSEPANIWAYANSNPTFVNTALSFINLSGEIGEIVKSIIGLLNAIATNQNLKGTKTGSGTIYNYLEISPFNALVSSQTFKLVLSMIKTKPLSGLIPENILSIINKISPLLDKVLNNPDFTVNAKQFLYNLLSPTVNTKPVLLSKYFNDYFVKSSKAEAERFNFDPKTLMLQYYNTVTFNLNANATFNLSPLQGLLSAISIKDILNAFAIKLPELGSLSTLISTLQETTLNEIIPPTLELYSGEGLTLSYWIDNAKLSYTFNNQTKQLYWRVPMNKVWTFNINQTVSNLLSNIPKTIDGQKISPLLAGVLTVPLQTLTSSPIGSTKWLESTNPIGLMDEFNNINYGTNIIVNNLFVSTKTYTSSIYNSIFNQLKALTSNEKGYLTIGALSTSLQKEILDNLFHFGLGFQEYQIYTPQIQIGLSYKLNIDNFLNSSSLITPVYEIKLFFPTKVLFKTNNSYKLVNEISVELNSIN